jgi:hypothetical protein
MFIAITITFLNTTLLITQWLCTTMVIGFEESVPTPQRTQRISIRNAVPKNSRIFYESHETHKHIL